MKDTGSVSEIYSSPWKPWSYLTGDADSAETESSNVTTQQTTTLTGFTSIYNLGLGSANYLAYQTQQKQTTKW